MTVKQAILYCYNKIYDWLFKAYDFVTSRHRSMSVAWLMEPDGDGQPSLLQLIVASRLLDIEDYFKGNNTDFRYMRVISESSKYYNHRQASADFEKLIHSFVVRGYDPRSRLVVDRNMKLWNGTHRLALCLYMGIDTVNVTVRQRECDYHKTVQWLESVLSSEDFNAILDRYHAVVQCQATTDK